MNDPSQPSGAAAVTFQFGEFIYDTGSRLLTCAGEKRHLSPKAQQLLQLLLAARPRALSREALYDALWPSTFVCETNLASVVKEIRRALGDDARASQYIRTVHGYGYAFGGEVVAVQPGMIAAVLICGDASHPLYVGENSVGRSPDARIVLTHGTISRRHALITIYENDSTFSIKDLESKNGTSVDGNLIGSAPVLVRGSAPLGFGAVTASVRFRKISTTKSLRLNMPELKKEIAARSASGQ